MSGTQDKTVRRVVEAALQRGYLTQAQLQQALQLQEQQLLQGRPGELLPILRERFLQPEHVSELLALLRGHEETRVDPGGVPAQVTAAPGTAGAARVGPYEVRRELGKGGMGVVLEGYDPRMRRAVAIKKILGEVGDEALRRFEREARLAGTLRHPGIAQVYEVVLEGPDAPYLVMELVEGKPLIDLCRGERLNGRRVATMVRGLCDAIGTAHDAKVLHRDLKPHNVLITEGDAPVVLDFGLAKQTDASSLGLTQSGQMLGTLAYMAPEQVEEAGRVDGRADVYGLGAILYQCLTGKPPFEGATQVNLLNAVLTKDPRTPRSVDGNIHQDLETICLKCLEKDPAHRYPSARALGDELRRFLDGDPIEARPVPGFVRLGRRLWRRKGILAAASLLLALVGVGGVYAVDRITSETVRAERSDEARRKIERAAELLKQLEEARRFRYLPLEPTEEAEAELIAGARAELQKILVELLALTQDEPRPPQVYVHQGWAQLALLDLKDAKATAEKAIALEAGGAAHLLLGRVLSTEMFLRIVGLTKEEGVELAGAAAEQFRLAQAQGQPLDQMGAAWLAVVSQEEQEALDLLEAMPAHRATEEKMFLHACLHYFVRGDPVRGLELLHGALRICPRMILGLLARGTHLATRDAAQARADLKRVLMLKPGFVVALRGLGLAEGFAGNSQAALRYLSEAIRIDPDYEYAYGNRSTVYINLKDFPRALADIEQAIRIAPANGMYRATRGVIKALSGDSEGALADYAEAIRLSPKQFSAYSNRAELLRKLGDHQGALADYAQALRLRPTEAGVYRSRGLLWMRRDPQRALKDFDSAIRLAPGDYLARLNRGVLKTKQGDHAGAVEDFERAIRSRATVGAYVNLGSAQTTLGNLRKAELAIAQAFRLDPKSSAAFACRANLKMRRRDLRGALADYDAALRLKPEFPDAFFNRAKVKVALRDSRGALADYGSAIRLRPTFAKAFVNRGNLKCRLRDYQGGLADHEQAVRLAPKQAHSYANRGMTYFFLGRIPEAQADAERAIRLDPKYWLGYRLRASCAFKLGKPRDAALAWEQMLRRNPRAPLAAQIRQQIQKVLGRSSRY